ncbi:hypothetical protein GGX14DRAFT_573407 [Mycena pura]|uniref:Uncharacterized protein n=1 Tax=Mycena pura TaxID=153505 RepID=A0AAD6V019_9AGAR|nr:hypothetical protein GGX14DRAFT_573407 [Mycena pura]
MPARRDRIAPVFDSHKPRELPKYFSDLAFLFSCSHVTADADQKFHATHFLAIDDQELWELLPEFADHAVSFTEFTAAIFRLYPEANPNRRYSLTDLDTLVTSFSRTISPSRTAFLEFYRRFLVISSFLISKGRLAVFEQSRALVRAIPSNIWPSVHARLHIRCPNKHLDDTYPLDVLHDAIDFILISNPASLAPPPAPSTAATPVPLSTSLAYTSTSASYDPSLAALVSAVNELTHLVSTARLSPVASHFDSPPSPHHPAPRPSPSLPSRPASCSYCSNPAHLIARCPFVAVDIAAGVCKRNAEGKIVLPSGLFILHGVVGSNLRARIASWHAANSVARPAPVLQSQTDPSSSRVCIELSASTPSRQQSPTHLAHHEPSLQPHDPASPLFASLSRSAPTPARVSPPTSVPSLSEQDHIAALKSQIAMLRARRQDARIAAITTAPETCSTAVFLSQVVSPSPEFFQPRATCSIDKQRCLDPPHRQLLPATSKIRAYTPLLAPQIDFASPAPYHAPEPQLASALTNKPSPSSLASSYSVKTHPMCPEPISASTATVSQLYAPHAVTRAVASSRTSYTATAPAPVSSVASSCVLSRPEQSPCTVSPVSVPPQSYKHPSAVEFFQERPVHIESHLPLPHSFPEPYAAMQSRRSAPLSSQSPPGDLVADFEFPANSMPALSRSASTSRPESAAAPAVTLASIP